MFPDVLPTCRHPDETLPPDRRAHNRCNGNSRKAQQPRRSYIFLSPRSGIALRRLSSRNGTPLTTPNNLRTILSTKGEVLKVGGMSHALPTLSLKVTPGSTERRAGFSSRGFSMITIVIVSTTFLEVHGPAP